MSFVSAIVGQVESQAPPRPRRAWPRDSQGGKARMPMATTGPLPVIRDAISGTQRMATLEHMGAFCGDVIPYGYATADAVIDPCRGVLFIAADPDPDPGDWAAIVGLIRAVGWDNGSYPHSDDPGEPFWDALGGVCTWRIEYVRQCIWCDGMGCSYGCPLCERVRLG